jgi:hypothetical protein
MLDFKTQITYIIFTGVVRITFTRQHEKGKHMRTKQEIQAEIEKLQAEFSEAEKRTEGKFVLVHSTRYGVFCGYLIAKSGDEVVLGRCRKIFRWRGANTLREVALHGVDLKNRTRLSECVDEQFILDVGQIIPCKPEAVVILDQAVWNA